MKTLFINKNIEIRRFEGQQTITILLDNEQSKNEVLLLILLKEKLVEKIEIKFNNLTIYLSINNNETKSTCSFINFNEQKFKGKISMNLLEYAICYLLKYFRDGIAESEHIDLDFDHKDFIVTLILKIKEFKEYSADEITKLIDL